MRGHMWKLHRARHFLRYFLCQKVIVFSRWPLYYFSTFSQLRREISLQRRALEKRLRGRWQASVRASVPRKIRVTQLHTVPQVSQKKALLVIGSILVGLKPSSLRVTVRETRGTEFILLSQLRSLLHLDWPEKEKTRAVTLVTSSVLNRCNIALKMNTYIRFFYIFIPKKKKRRKLEFSADLGNAGRNENTMQCSEYRSSISCVNCFSREVFTKKASDTWRSNYNAQSSRTLSITLH